MMKYVEIELGRIVGKTMPGAAKPIWRVFFLTGCEDSTPFFLKEFWK
jgi:hypothetical protein